MSFLGFPLIDIVVILLYFAVVVWIGYRSMKRVGSSEDYFLAGRKFGRWIQTFAAFGQGTSAESAVGTTTMVTRNGAAGIGFMIISGIISMPIFWLTTLWYRRLRYLSLAEFFSERYGSKRMAGFYAVSQTIMFMIVVALGFTAMSKTVSAIAEKPVSALTQEETCERQLAQEYYTLKQTDARLLSAEDTQRLDQLSAMAPRLSFSYINRTWLTIILAVIILLYAVSGGLEAAFITDMIQGIFIILLTLMLIPFAMLRINAIHGVEGFMGTFDVFHRVLPDAFFQLFGSPSLPQFTWYYIAAFGVMSIFNTGVQANQLTAAGSAKDDEVARSGFLSGIFIKRYCTVFWGFVAMMLLVLYGTSVSDPDMVWGMACRELLPTGLLGLMVACLMAALMSTADALMLTSSSLLTNSVFRPLFPGLKDKTYVQVGRVFCLFYIIGGVLIAISVDDVMALFILMLSFNAMIAATFWVGMLWRRATRPAAWCSIAVTFIFTVFLPVLIPAIPGVRSAKALALRTKGYDVERSYVAKQVDVEQRREEIVQWDALHAVGAVDEERPQELVEGNRFVRKTYIEPVGVFWQMGLRSDDAGALEGKGMLKVDLLLMHWMGLNLENNKPAMNETIGVLFRIFVPFSILFLVSLLTPMEERSRLDFFYARLRTAVQADHKADDAEVARVRQNPSLRDDLKLFPGSNWEFRKWNRMDWTGQGYVLLAIAGLVVLLLLLVRLGSGA